MPRRGWIAVVVGLALFGGGVAIGARFVARRPTPATARQGMQVAIPRAPLCATSVTAPTGASAGEVRAIVRDELSRLSPSPPTSGSGDDASAPVPVSRESEAAEQQAREIVDVALASGRWTAEDRDALRRLFPQLGREQSETITALIIPAINDGRLSVDLDGPLL